MGKEFDPNCRGCFYAPPEGKVINSDGSPVTDRRIGDESFSQTDDPFEVLKAYCANAIICEVCKGSGYFLKTPVTGTT